MKLTHFLLFLYSSPRQQATRSKVPSNLFWAPFFVFRLFSNHLHGKYSSTGKHTYFLFLLPLFSLYSFPFFIPYFPLPFFILYSPKFFPFFSLTPGWGVGQNIYPWISILFHSTNQLDIYLHLMGRGDTEPRCRCDGRDEHCRMWEYVDVNNNMTNS